MKKLLLTLLFPLAAFGQSSENRIVEGAYFPNSSAPKNYIKNSTCDKNANDIAKTGAATLAASATNKIKGAKSCAIDASAAAETITWSSFTFEKEIYGQNCEAKFKYGGNAVLYKAYVKQGAVQVTPDYQLQDALSNSTEVSISFPCGDGSAATTFVLEATGDGALVQVDDVYVGKSTNIGSISQAVIAATATQPGAANCTFTENVSVAENDFYSLSSAPSCASSWITTGAPVTATPTLNQITYPNMPAGDWEITVDAYTFVSTATLSVCNFRFTDGTNFFGYGVSAPTTDSAGSSIHGTITYNDTATRVFDVQAANPAAVGNDCRIENGAAGRSIIWTFKRYPKASEQVIRNAVPYHQLYAAKTSSVGVVSNENIDFINGNCTNPSTGNYTCTFNTGRFVNTPNCWIADTFAPQSAITALSASAVSFETRDNAGTLTDTAAGISCQDKDAASLPAPILVGSVTSDAPNALKLEGVRITLGAAPAIVSQTGTAFVSVAGAAAIKTITMTGWAAAPYCTTSSGVVATNFFTTFNVIPTATTLSIVPTDSPTGAGIAASASDFIDIICLGAR